MVLSALVFSVHSSIEQNHVCLERLNELMSDQVGLLGSEIHTGSEVADRRNAFLQLGLWVPLVLRAFSGRLQFLADMEVVFLVQVLQTLDGFHVEDILQLLEIHVGFVVLVVAELKFANQCFLLVKVFFSQDSLHVLFFVLREIAFVQDLQFLLLALDLANHLLVVYQQQLVVGDSLLQEAVVFGRKGQLDPDVGRDVEHPQILEVLGGLTLSAEDHHISVIYHDESEIPSRRRVVFSNQRKHVLILEIESSDEFSGHSVFSDILLAFGSLAQPPENVDFIVNVDDLMSESLQRRVPRNLLEVLLETTDFAVQKKNILEDLDPNSPHDKDVLGVSNLRYGSLLSAGQFDSGFNLRRIEVLFDLLMESLLFQVIVEKGEEFSMRLAGGFDTVDDFGLLGEYRNVFIFQLLFLRRRVSSEDLLNHWGVLDVPL